MMCAPLLLLFAYLVLVRSEKHQNITWYVFILSLTICIYTPGLVWFLIIALATGYKKITKTIFKIDSFNAVLGLVVLILLVAPMGYAVIQNVHLLREWLAIPSKIPSIFDFLDTAVHSFGSLTYQMHGHNDYSVGKFAILSIVQTVLATAGIVAVYAKSRKEIVIILAMLIIGVVLSALNNSLVYLIMCLPAVAILDAAGLLFLYGKWFSVFPLNPIARLFAWTLITLVLVGQVAYGVRYALLAWPHNMETRKTHMIQ
jgi:hypothetical protein